MFLGLLDADLDPVVGGMDPAPDPSHNQAKIVIETLIPTVFVTSL